MRTAPRRARGGHGGVSHGNGTPETTAAAARPQAHCAAPALPKPGGIRDEPSETVDLDRPSTGSENPKPQPETRGNPDACAAHAPDGRALAAEIGGPDLFGHPPRPRQLRRPPPIAVLERHVHELLAEHDIWWCIGRPADSTGIAWRAERQIMVPSLRQRTQGATRYLICLHEIGHIAGACSADVYRNEAAAWRWAKAVSLFWDARAEAHVAALLRAVACQTADDSGLYSQRDDCWEAP